MKPQTILFQVEEISKDIPGEYAIWMRKSRFQESTCGSGHQSSAEQNWRGRLEVLQIFSYISGDFIAPSVTSEEGYILSIGRILFLYLKTTLTF